MRLRTRLLLTAAIITAPVLGVLAVVDMTSRQSTAAALLAGLLRDQVSSSQQIACEADPTHYGGELPRPGHPPPGVYGGTESPQSSHRPAFGMPPHVWVYRADGTALRPEAPPLSRAPDADGQMVALSHALGSDVRVGVLTGWGDPCAILVVQGSTVAGGLGAVLPATRVWLLPLLLLVGVLVVAVGPVLVRLERLTAAVRQLHRDDYAVPVVMSGDDELNGLAQAFNEAALRVRQEMAAKEQREQALRSFLMDTTHDIMVPLTVLQGHLAAIRDQAAVRGPISAAALTGAMDEAQYLGELLRNLDASARLGVAGRPEERLPVDLNDLVARTTARHRTLAQQHAVSLEHAVPAAQVVICTEGTLLEQALSNLIQNAVLYNRPDGHVAVTLEEEPGAFVLCVVDDGPGIPAAALAQALTRGGRLDPARSRGDGTGGRGLGLHIVQQVCQRAGLTFTLQTSEFGGAEASIRGPRAAALPPATARSAPGFPPHT